MVDDGSELKPIDQGDIDKLDFKQWDIQGIAKDKKYNPFNPELDQQYPLDKIIPQELKDIMEQPNIERVWVSLLNNSPLGNWEAERTIGTYIEISTEAGQWLDIPIFEDEELEVDDLENEDEDAVAEFSGETLRFQNAANLLIEKGYMKKVLDDDGTEWLKPQKKLMEFIKSRMPQAG